MTKMETGEANEWARRIWNTNAAFWDQRMGEGNDFVNYLIWPATEGLLELKAVEEVLDIACGNGFASRKLSGMGAKVAAFDFSGAMVEAARSVQSEADHKIDYRQLDATDSSHFPFLLERELQRNSPCSGGQGKIKIIRCPLGIWK
jgi:2-polyprenyl-3-methyl-5-hydroxy-6-metoxy-1,4-benzoquinol methylase